MKNKNIIVFAGDSTTDAEKLSTYDKLGNGYVRLVRNYLLAFRPEKWYEVVNAGVSGNTSRDLLARWEQDVAGCNPDIIFCLIGINDVWRHFDGKSGWDNLVDEGEFEENMRKICARMQEKKAYVMSPFYLERNRTDEMRVMTERYAQIAKKVAAEYGIEYIDTQACFDKFMQSLPGQFISWDRVHPCEVGSMILARAALEQILK